jgi:glutathione S-transferase
MHVLPHKRRHARVLLSSLSPLATLKAVGANQFLTGDSVSVADLCVFGCLRAIEGMDTHAEVLAAHDDLRAWYNRVADAVGESACVQWT